MFSLQDAGDYKENVTSSILGAATLTTGRIQLKVVPAPVIERPPPAAKVVPRKKKDSVKRQETLGKLLGESE
jgi:hypothetical protein